LPCAAVMGEAVVECIKVAAVKSGRP
jgi:hypothetical protein